MARKTTARSTVLTDGETVIDDSGRGMLDGNGRVARLARWLRERPSSADVDTLVFELKNDGEWDRVQTWRRDAVTLSLANMIDAMAQDSANELGAFVHVRAAWWCSATNVYWTAHQMKVQPDNMGAQQAFSGDGQSVTIQLQNNLHKMITLHTIGIGEGVALAREQAQDVRERSRRAERECDELRARVAILEREKLEFERRCQQLEDDLEAAVELATEASDKAASNKGEAEQTNALVTMIGAAMSRPAAPS